MLLYNHLFIVIGFIDKFINFFKYKLSTQIIMSYKTEKKTETETYSLKSCNKQLVYVGDILLREGKVASKDTLTC